MLTFFGLIMLILVFSMLNFISFRSFGADNPDPSDFAGFHAAAAVLMPAPLPTDDSPPGDIARG